MDCPIGVCALVSIYDAAIDVWKIIIGYFLCGDLVHWDNNFSHLLQLFVILYKKTYFLGFVMLCIIQSAGMFCNA